MSSVMSSVMSSTGISAALLSAMLVATNVAQASVASDITGLSGGRRVKLAWLRRNGGKKLMGFDTNDGVVREILTVPDKYCQRVLLTHDGSRVVYTDDAKIYVVNWNGTGLQEIYSPGFAGTLWYDEAGGKQYAIVQDGAVTGWQVADDAPLYMVNIDDPADKTLIWNKSRVTIQWMAISKDGTRLGGSFPWDSCGVATIPNGTYTYYGDGCLSAISPDNAYRITIFDGAHRNWDTWDAGRTNHRVIDLNEGPDMRGWEVYWPQFSNDPSFMTITGQYDNGSTGTCASQSCGNLIGGDKRHVEVYFGKLDAGLTQVLQWVRVTTDFTWEDYAPDAWVAATASNDVRIDSFTASPTTIAEGETSTLSWATTYATSVSINQGIGTVSADDTRSVTPAATTTYTLTAQGTGGPVTRQVTVTVQTLRDPDSPGSTQAGLAVSYYTLSSPSLLPDFGPLVPYKSSTVTQINYPDTSGNFADSGRADNLGAVFTGYVEVPAGGVYTFYTESDDGSALYIGATKVVDNDGPHGMTEKSGQIGLKAGKHQLRVEFFEATGGAGLIVRYEGPGISKLVIPASALSHVAAAVQLASIQVAPAQGYAEPGGTVQFTASAKDQYGDPFAAVISWSVSGGGNMSPGSSGSAVTEHTSTFTSSGTEGTFTVTASSGGVSGTATVTAATAAPLHMKINCGRNEYEVTGWERDDAYVSGGNDYTFANTADTSGEPQAAPADVYRTCRHLDHAYDFSGVPDGTYTVRLHFYDEGTGAGRAMDYTIEGVKVLDDFNIADAVGTGKALVKEFAVTVSDGNGLQIVAEKDTGNDALDCGVEIIGAGVVNTQPTVDAGAGSTVEVGSPANLNATVTDDGLPSGTLTYQWTKESGPGSVTFADENAEDTTASFSEAGEYVLRLTVTDGELSASDEVTITVVEPTEPAITLISPNGGEVWYVGETRYVTWASYNLDSASIAYSTDGGVSTKALADVVNKGDAEWLCYPWQVPDEPSTQCIVYVSGYFGEARTQSASFFEIRWAADADGDGMDDAWETANFGDLTHDGTVDTDADGLTDLQEFQYGTNPNRSDTDGDGMPDKWEIDYGLDPTVDDSGLDPDGDGYSNLEEYFRGGDPRDPNSTGGDGDGTGFGCVSGLSECGNVEAGVRTAGLAAVVVLAVVSAAWLRRRRRSADWYLS